MINIDRYKEELLCHNPLIIWGSGSAGKEILDFIKSEKKTTTIFFVDSNPNFWNKTRHGCFVYPPSELPSIMDNNSNAKILIGSKSIVEINETIRSMGIDDYLVDDNTLGIVRNFISHDVAALYSKNKNLIENVRNMLADEKSKTILDKVVKYRTTGILSLLNNIASNPISQYFERELIQLGEHETFVDCGGYTGDTLDTFLTVTNNKYDAYYIFEPDEDVFSQLTEKLSNFDTSKIFPFNYGCWNSNTSVRFNKSGTWSSHIDEMGDTVIDVVALDNVLAGKDVSFIKMDIEGAEKEAIRGCSRIISDLHPKLAISIYHHAEDLYLIPLMIQELYGEYKLYIRMYAECNDTEIICYAL